MQYIAAHTNIPIPKLYAVHTLKEKRLIYIEMAYIQGVDLDKAWQGLNKGQKDAIFQDIKRHVCDMRQLKPPPPGLIGSAFQKQVYDTRIGYRFFGPFDLCSFHSLVRSHLREEDVAESLGNVVEKVQTTDYRIFFSHADLAPRNVIIRDGRVAAIVDWGYAGWYPEYWEFTKSHYNYFPGEGWGEYLRSALPCFESELVAERILWRILPEPGTARSSHFDSGWMEHPGSSPSAAWTNARRSTQSMIYGL